MKKRIITILVVVLMAFTSLFGGCNIVSVNEQKDMHQIIATVKISEDVPTTRSQIEKQEMVMDYISYGYYYVYNGEKTQKQVIEMILENLVGTEIILQSIMLELDANTSFQKNDNYGKWEVERYLTTQNEMNGDECVKLSEIDEAKYQTLKAINDLIETYVEPDDEVFGDTNSETVRVVPTDAKNAEEKLTENEKYQYINKNDSETKNGIKIGAVGSKQRKAYNKFIKFVNENKLIGENFVNDFITSAYYKRTFVSYKENALLEKYEKLSKAQKRQQVTYADLAEKYAEMYEAQVGGFSGSSADFESALSSANASTPVIYSPFGGYAYVYNLLIGINGEQTSAIENLKKDYKTDSVEYKTERREILQSITAKDLRSTWILSGYDYDFNNNKFTGDYAFLEDSYAFQGNVTCLKEKDGDKPAEYRIDSVVEFGLDAFIEEINNYLFGANVGAVTNAKPEVYYEYNSNSQVKPANYDEKINELLFAYSTDSGSLNTYKGYMVSPKPDADGTETYMQEFADGARALMEMGDSSYLVVATDYGYHFMFYSTVLDADVNYETLEEYLDSLEEADWEAKYNDMVANWDELEEEDSYLYKFAKLITDVDSFYTKKQNEFINKYRYDKTKVTINSATYADLIG